MQPLSSDMSSSSPIQTCFGGDDMCTDSTHFYRGSGSNYHTNSMRQWATLTRQSQGNRLHIESGSSAVPVTAVAPTSAAVKVDPKQAAVKVDPKQAVVNVDPKQAVVKAVKMPKAAPIPTPAKFS